MELRELAQKALAKAKWEGASQAEAFAVASRTVSVYVDDGRIKNAEEKSDQGLSVRVLKGRKLAQASSSCVSREEAEACAHTASRLADLSPPSRNYERLPSPTPGTLDPHNYDERTAAVGTTALTEVVKQIVDAAGAGGVKVPKGMVRAAAVESMVLNSNGVDVTRSNTMVYAELTSMTNGTVPGEGILTFTSPTLGALDPVKAGGTLAERATAASTATSFDGSRKIPVLIAPGDLADMLETSVAFAVSAESVNKKRSAWAEKLGQEVAASAVTIVDDPSDPRAVLSSAYDDEGVPTTVKNIVENGVLKTFLFDSYNAAVVNRTPSGNGLRRAATNSQYVFQMPLGAGHINLVVKPGPRTREQMIASLDEGVLVEKFAFPTVNPITGAFAMEVRLGYTIKGGSITGQFKQALVIGNMFEALKRVRDIGSDATVTGSMIIPTMAFDDLEIIGSH
jgi:PmbA protein